MILINSAAYVNSDLQSEFGPIPPAFLPVGNKRLFEHQIQILRRSFPNEQLTISLPDTFSVAKKDISYLGFNNVAVLLQPPNLSLAQSIHSSICEIGSQAGPLRILHGDTLYLEKIPEDPNLIAISQVEIAEVYEIDRTRDSKSKVWSGYFSFENVPMLKDLLSNTQITFPANIRIYDSQIPMTRFELTNWCDFGHVNSYFQSRGRLTTARAFNTLSISAGIVRKSGEPATKINAERQWFENLPQSLRRFIPNLLNDGVINGSPYYEMEYLPFPPLNEVFVHGQQPLFYWSNIFDLFKNYFQSCAAVPLSNQDFDNVILGSIQLGGPKTEERLAQYFLSTNAHQFDTPLIFNGTLMPNLKEITRVCHEIFVSGDAVPGVLHGDFCLSNILYDTRANRIKVIDPRGTNYLNQPSIFGDLRYDLAKLTHSFLGLYDHLISGSFSVRKKVGPEAIELNLEIFISEQTSLIQNLFQKRFLEHNRVETLALTVLLFLSALPLHSDNKERQDAFLANALRIYKDFIMEPQL